MEKELQNNGNEHGKGRGGDDALGHDKEYKIIVNGRPKTHKGKWITFEQVVELAYGVNGNHGNTIYTVTYSRGEKPNPQGTLVAGERVRVKDGMIFNVTPSDKS